MKIIDRYVITSFLKNYLISFMILVGMYVILDMVFKFDEFAKVGGKTDASGYSAVFTMMSDMADYYFFQCFLFFVQLSGIIPVVAAAFTLMRFSRFNELAAILAAGVPLLRVAMPIILVSVLLNALLLVDQELVIPQLIPKLVRDPDDLNRVGPKTFPIQLMQDDQRSLLNAALYRPATAKEPATMVEVDIIERDKELNGVAHITADKGTWDTAKQEWMLVNGRRLSGIQPGGTRGPEETVDVYRSNIDPNEIALFRTGSYVDLLSTRQIDELLSPSRGAMYGRSSLLRVKHFRFTQPLMNVVLLLLAIPCVLSREPGKLKSAATKCLILTGLGMGSIFLSHQLAGQNTIGPDWADRWPAMMAWVPVIVFLPLAIYLLDILHTKKS
jgi:lipopolysaccharide export system permease protein